MGFVSGGSQSKKPFVFFRMKWFRPGRWKVPRVRGGRDPLQCVVRRVCVCVCVVLGLGSFGIGGCRSHCVGCMVHALKILKMLCIGACMKALLGFLFEDRGEVLLLRSLEILFDVWVWGSGMKPWWVADIAQFLAPKQVDAASVPIISNLICYRSIAYSYCCLYLEPPDTVCGPLPV